MTPFASSRTSRTIRPTARPARWSGLVAAVLGTVLVASCSSGGADAEVADTTAAVVGTSAAVSGGVVVPGLDGSQPVDIGGVTVPGKSDPSAVTTTVPAEPTDPAPATTDPAPATTAVVTSAPEPPTPSVAPSSAPAPQPSTSAATPTGSVLSVELSGCEGCEVIGSHQDVAGGRSAALISRGGRGAVVSVDAAGQVVGVANIPYGAEFPAPAGGLLPCDTDGRCVVTARQTDGTAVLSVFGLGADGAWTDLSGDSGYPSSTAQAQPVVIGDTLGLAVQDTDGDLTIWMVLSWSGSGFVVDGCAPDGPVPSPTTLDPELCLS